MLDFTGKTVSLIGYGVSNRALGEHLRSRGIDFVVRCRDGGQVQNGQNRTAPEGDRAACAQRRDTKNGCESIAQACDTKNGCESIAQACDTKNGCESIAQACDTKNGCESIAQACDTKNGCESNMQGCVVGKSYLDTREDIVFRSPGVNPKLIRGGGRVYTEVGYALEMAKCKKIGVTGSDGKTTTVTLIHQMLRAGGKGAYLCGNIGYPAIDAAAVACSEDYMVAELSSFQLMDMAPCLDVAAVTNISQNHLDWHADMDEYICAKKNIVKNASLAVLNYDDFVVRSFEAEKKIYFSLGDRRDLVLKGQDFVHVVHGNVCYNECVLFPVSHVKLRGEYNLQNVLCAIGCTHGIVDGQSCHRVAKEFCGVGFRGECVGVKNGVAFINSAIDTTPTRTKNTLSAFDITKVIAILGGYDKNLDYSCLKEALAGAKAVILCGENREKIGAAVKRRVINVNTLNEAVDVAKSLASQGDFVILTPASASFDMFKDYKEKGRCFTSACDLALS